MHMRTLTISIHPGPLDDEAPPENHTIFPADMAEVAEAAVARAAMHRRQATATTAMALKLILENKAERLDYVALAIMRLGTTLEHPAWPRVDMVVSS